VQFRFRAGSTVPTVNYLSCFNGAYPSLVSTRCPRYTDALRNIALSSTFLFLAALVRVVINEGSEVKDPGPVPPLCSWVYKAIVGSFSYTPSQTVAMRFSNLLQVALLSFALTITASDQFDSQSYLADHIITRDVVIIGGGSSGTYAAVNLRRLGKSVVVVEKDATLGGHTNSYTDPSTGNSVDYGVLAYWNSEPTFS
jgi:hypothetical protein